MTEFAQCLGFDLTNTLAGHVELLAHFFQGVVGIHINSETHPQDFRFSSRQSGQHLLSRFAQACDGRMLDRRHHPRIPR